MSFRKIISVLVLIAVVLCAFAGCGSDSDSDSGKKSKKSEKKEEFTFEGTWECTLDLGNSLVKFAHDPSIGNVGIDCECIWEFTEDEFKITVTRSPSYDVVMERLEDEFDEDEAEEIAEKFMEKYSEGNVAFSGSYEIDGNVIDLGALYKFTVDGDSVSLKWYDVEEEDGGSTPHFFRAKLERVEEDK